MTSGDNRPFVNETGLLVARAKDMRCMVGKAAKRKADAGAVKHVAEQDAPLPPKEKRAHGFDACTPVSTPPDEKCVYGSFDAPPPPPDDQCVYVDAPPPPNDLCVYVDAPPPDDQCVYAVAPPPDDPCGYAVTPPPDDPCGYAVAPPPDDPCGYAVAPPPDDQCVYVVEEPTSSVYFDVATTRPRERRSNWM